MLCRGEPALDPRSSAVHLGGLVRRLVEASTLRGDRGTGSIRIPALKLEPYRAVEPSSVPPGAAPCRGLQGRRCK